MKAYVDIFNKVKKVCHGSFLILFLSILCTSFTYLILVELQDFFINKQSIYALPASLSLSIINIFVSNIVIFVFLKKARSQNLVRQDIKQGIKKMGMMVGFALVLNLLQVGIMMFTMFFASIYWFYVVLQASLFIFFTWWISLTSLYIYDNEATFMNSLQGSLSIIIKNYKACIFMAVGLFIVFYAGQIIIPMLAKSLMGDVKFAGVFIALLQQSGKGVNTALPVMFLVNALYYCLQYICKVYIFMHLTLLYESGKVGRIHESH